MAVRRLAVLLLLLGAVAAARPAGAAGDERLKVVATFSILGDMVERVGGERVAVTTLVKPQSDTHAFRASPSDAEAIAGADLLVANGLGFEGWIERLIAASGFAGPVVRAADAVETLPSGPGSAVDPHAWQSLPAAQTYVDTIAAALAAADPAGAAGYESRAAAYRAEMEALDAELRERLAALPEDRRSIVTNHDAFGYFEHEYGVRFIAPAGVSTEAEASARNVAAIIRFVREEGIDAVFLESVTNPRLLQQIASETGATIGGTLYSDALSGPDGPAPTYLAMMRHNIDALIAALGG